jgi:hypothetical protein
LRLCKQGARDLRTTQSVTEETVAAAVVDFAGASDE